ncbi:MAG: hypothetical protein WC222_06515 [Parachlamydiales bacterium]|jgi:hypothetical protein
MDERPTVILIATGEAENLDHNNPSPLWRVGDKPIIVHILEVLSKANIKNFEIILHHYPEAIEKIVRNGSRWGVNIKYHLVKSRNHPYRTLTPIFFNTPSKIYMLGQADFLPVFPHDFLHYEETSPFLLFEKDNSWSGWGIFPTDLLQGISHEIPRYDLHLHIGDKFRKETIEACLSTRSAPEVLNSNISILSHAQSLVSLPSTAYSPEDDIWISHGAIIHPTAKLISPLFIGEQCKINKNTTIGPNAIIERWSLVDKNSTIENALICRRSYVGESLTIQDSIVEKNILINIHYGTPVTIREGFILSEITPPSLLHYFLHYLGRLVALLLFILISPFYFLLWMTYGFQDHSFVFLPSVEGITKIFNWPYFNIPAHYIFAFMRKSPGLIPLIRGELHWIGVSAKTRDEIENLPYYWKKLYCQSKVGFITLADLDYNLDYNFDDLIDERYASDIFYAANSSISFDAKVTIRWLLSPLVKLFQKRT